MQPGEYDVFFSSGFGGTHTEYKVKAPGVVIGRKGTLGTVFLVICYPPIATQRKIADMLSNYDRLIENNTRCIKILEEMTQLLYREWFINFRFPGYTSC